MKELKVSGMTIPKKLAGALLHSLEDSGADVVLNAVGPTAVNQAVKAIAIASHISKNEGFALSTDAQFSNAEDNPELTVMRLQVSRSPANN